MFLGGQKLRPYIPMAKARGFTGAIDKLIEVLDKVEEQIEQGK